MTIFDDDEIIERGTHGGLVARDGRYADLWRVQVGAVADDQGAARRLPCHCVPSTR